LGICHLVTNEADNHHRESADYGPSEGLIDPCFQSRHGHRVAGRGDRCHDDLLQEVSANGTGNQADQAMTNKSKAMLVDHRRGRVSPRTKKLGADNRSAIPQRVRRA